MIFLTTAIGSTAKTIASWIGLDQPTAALVCPNIQLCLAKFFRTKCLHTISVKLVRRRVQGGGEKSISFSNFALPGFKF